MFSFMLFIFLGFLGVLAVSFYLLFRLDRISRTLREEHAQMRLLLRSLEARLSSAEAIPEPSKPLQDETETILTLDFGRKAQTKAPLDPTLDLHMDGAKN